MYSFVCVFHSLPSHHTRGFMCPLPKSRDKSLHHEDPCCSSFTARPTSLPASLAHSPACGILSFVCVFFKFLLSFHDYPASTLVPRTLWFKLLAAVKALTESCRQCLRIFLFVKLAVKLEECMGSEIKLDKFATNKQLIPHVQVKRFFKTEHLKRCPIKYA